MCEDAGRQAPYSEALRELLSTVERLSLCPRGERAAAQIGAELVLLRHACDLLELEFSAAAARFAATDEYDQQGSVSPIAWIRHHCRMSGHAASSAVCVGEQSDGLPRSVEALCAGRIGFAHLTLLASTAQGVSGSPTAAGFDEAPLLRRAEQHTVSRFRHDCEHARHAADAQAFLAEHVEAVEWRRLELLPCGGGGLVVRGILDAVGGATLRTALEPLAQRSGADDTRDRARRLADAMVQLAEHGLDTGQVLPGGGRRPHLQVTASLETLQGLIGAPAGELEYSPPIPAVTVQRIACDATITRVLLGPDSAVVDVGRSRRLPAESTRCALRLRDQGCVWPGCDRPASWTQAHHLRHWAHGGTTDMANLVLVCGRHHWMAHEGGWQLVRGGNNTLHALPPLQDYLPPARAPAPATAVA